MPLGSKRSILILMLAIILVLFPWNSKVPILDIVNSLAATTVFIGVGEEELIFWVCKKGKEVQLRTKQISDNNGRNSVATYCKS